jgi:selT/selW/selH-like putative selenoprotein
LRAELLKGSRGVFDVRLDGELLFSKHEVHRFPEPGEVVAALRQRLSA